MSLSRTGSDPVQLRPDQLNSNQINSKCCLPRFETQSARNTYPVMSLGSTGGDPVQLRPDQINSDQINSTQTRPTQSVVSLGLKHNWRGTYTRSWPSVARGVTRFNSDQINNNCDFKVLFLCCNANNHRYLEISLSTQVCKLIIIKYIYICSNKFQGSCSGTYHTGRKPLQQTLRGVNHYNTPGHVPR
jgi:hypothetical protein